MSFDRRLSFNGQSLKGLSQVGSNEEGFVGHLIIGLQTTPHFGRAERRPSFPLATHVGCGGETRTDRWAPGGAATTAKEQREHESAGGSSRAAALRQVAAVAAAGVVCGANAPRSARRSRRTPPRHLRPAPPAGDRWPSASCPGAAAAKAAAAARGASTARRCPGRPRRFRWRRRGWRATRRSSRPCLLACRRRRSRRRPGCRPALCVPPELKVRTAAHTRQLRWHVEFESQGTHRFRQTASPQTSALGRKRPRILCPPAGSLRSP